MPNQYTTKLLRSIVFNRSLKAPLRWYFASSTTAYRRRTTLVRYHNRCSISGRTRGFYRFARVSRLFLRDPLLVGAFPGLRKSYW